jgi:hypothetical protein
MSRFTCIIAQTWVKMLTLVPILYVESLIGSFIIMELWIQWPQKPSFHLDFTWMTTTIIPKYGVDLEGLMNNSLLHREYDQGASNNKLDN